MKKWKNDIIDKEDVTSPIIDHYSEYSQSGGSDISHLSKFYNLSKGSAPTYKDIFNDPKNVNRGTFYIKNPFTGELEEKISQTNLYNIKTFDLISMQNLFKYKLNSPVGRTTKSWYDIALYNRNSPLLGINTHIVPEASTNITHYVILSAALCITAGGILYLNIDKSKQLEEALDKIISYKEIINIKETSIKELSKTISILEENNIADSVNEGLIDPTSTLIGTTIGLLIKIIKK